MYVCKYVCMYVCTVACKSLCASFLTYPLTYLRAWLHRATGIPRSRQSSGPSASKVLRQLSLRPMFCAWRCLSRMDLSVRGAATMFEGCGFDRMCSRNHSRAPFHSRVDHCRILGEAREKCIHECQLVALANDLRSEASETMERILLTQSLLHCSTSNKRCVALVQKQTAPTRARMCVVQV